MGLWVSGFQGMLCDKNNLDRIRLSAVHRSMSLGATTQVVFKYSFLLLRENYAQMLQSKWYLDIIYANHGRHHQPYMVSVDNIKIWYIKKEKEVLSPLSSVIKI